MNTDHGSADGGELVYYLRRIFERRLAQERREKTK